MPILKSFKPSEEFNSFIVLKYFSVFSSFGGITISPKMFNFFSWWKKISNIPCVAIGGITKSNFTPLLNHGANYVAVISSVWKHPKGPAFALNEYYKVFSELNNK